MYKIALATSLLVMGSTRAHSWIDCLSTNKEELLGQSNAVLFGGDSANGICAGYPRQYPGRGNSDINRLYSHEFTRTDVNAGVPVCQHATGNYTGWRHRLTAAAGDTVYYTYMPNGHVSKDEMARGTSANIYWTGDADQALASTLALTPEHLLGGFQDFDDGQCGETVNGHGQPSGRAGNGKPCIGQFSIPANTLSGVYEFAWFWRFYKEGQDGDSLQARGFFNSAYSTCFDIEIHGAAVAVVVEDETDSTEHELC